MRGDRNSSLTCLIQDFGLLPWLSGGLLAGGVDCLESRTYQGHRARIHLGRFWRQSTVLGAELGLDDLRYGSIVKVE